MHKNHLTKENPVDNQEYWKKWSEKYNDSIENYITMFTPASKNVLIDSTNYKEDEKLHPNPDWEICWTCSKRYTENCLPKECSPLDL